MFDVVDNLGVEKFLNIALDFFKNIFANFSKIYV